MSAPTSPSMPPASADTEVNNARTEPSPSVAASASDSTSVAVPKSSPFYNEATRSFDANALLDDIRAHHNASVSVVAALLADIALLQSEMNASIQDHVAGLYEETGFAFNARVHEINDDEEKKSAASAKLQSFYDALMLSMNQFFADQQ